MNKRIMFLLCGFLLLTATSNAQGSMKVTITNIREPKGDILIALFTNEGDFLTKSTHAKTVKAAGTQVTVSFEGLAPGDYAVSIIHDENSNGELDKNFMGIPREGFAFGNNSMGTFGPPSFEKAKVKVDGKLVVQEVAVKYM